MGKIVTKSITGRSFGNLKCTKIAVGTIKISSTRAVNRARRIDKKKAPEKPCSDGKDVNAQNENFPESFWSANLNPA